MIEAPTEDQVFRQWISEGRHKHNWRSEWRERWFTVLKFARDNHFWLLKLRGKEKIPIGPGWLEESLGEFESSDWVNYKRGNIGVVPGKCNPALISLDYDGKDIDDEITKYTLTSVTPNGFHFFVLAKDFDNERFKALQLSNPKWDLARNDLGYVVMPLSTTCKLDHSGHACEKRHDYRIHQWINMSQNPIPSIEFFSILRR